MYIYMYVYISYICIYIYIYIHISPGCRHPSSHTQVQSRRAGAHSPKSVVQTFVAVGCRSNSPAVRTNSRELLGCSSKESPSKDSKSALHVWNSFILKEFPRINMPKSQGTVILYIDRISSVKRAVEPGPQTVCALNLVATWVLRISVST